MTDNVWSSLWTFVLISWVCPYMVDSQSTIRTSTITPTPNGNENLFCEIVGGGIGATCLSTGLCIETESFCDSVNDCGDGQDERQCTESDECMMKRELVQKVKEQCPLRNHTMQGIPDRLLNRWTFNVSGSAEQEYVTQVKLSTSRQNVGGGTVLYQVRVGSFSSSRFLFNVDTPLLQIRELPIPVFFDAGSINVTVEMLNIDEFRPTSIDGLELNITLSSGSCDDVKLNCLLGVADLLSADLNCSKNLGGNVYTSVYNSDVCPLRPDCADHQFACRSGLCIPSSGMCDGFNDCTGAGEDESFICSEIGSCPIVSRNLLFETLTLCSTVRSIFVEATSEEISFLWEDDEGLYLTEIVVPFFDVSISRGLNRFNITTPSSSISFYYQIPFFTESEIPILLKRPLTVNPGDRVTVTKEFTPEYFRQPFVLLNVSLSQVRGFQPTSCESSRNCIDVLTSGANEDNRTNCAFSEYEDFLLDLYVQCRDPPRITYISQNASVVVDDVYTAVCHANGLPTSIIHWLDDNGQPLSLNQPLGPVSFINLQLRRNETFREVTCRAVSGNMTHEQTIRLSRLDLQDCNQDTIALMNQPAGCFPIQKLVRSPVFDGANNVTFTISFDGLIYEVNFGEGLLSVYGQIVDLTLEVTFASVSEDVTRARRGFGNLLYRKSYRWVVTENNVKLPIDPPLRVSNRSMLSISVSAINLVNENFEGFEIFINHTVWFSGISCESASCDLERLETALADACFDGQYSPEFEQLETLANTLKTCKGITSAEPSISLQPSPFVEAPTGDSVNTSCEAQNSVGISWYKREWYDDIETEVVGNILSFEDLSSEDQGIYYCRAQGGVGFEASPALSELVVIALSGRDTFLIQMTFLGLQYFDDLADPTSSTYLQNSTTIHQYFVSHIIEFGGGVLPSANDVIVQRLQPGSIVAEARITLERDAAIERIELALRRPPFGDFDNFQPDLQSLRLQAVSFCNEDFLNNTLAGELTFPRTNIALTANSIEVCPSYTDKVGEPRAFRTCVGDFVSPSVWDEVELNNCYEEVEDEDERAEDSLQELNKFLNNNTLTNENVTTVSYDVADATETTDLDGDDIVIIAEILEKITILENPSPEVTRNIIRVVDNILNLEEDVYNESTPSEAPSRIVQSLETQLTNLHRGGGDNLNFTEIRDYIAVKALSVEKDYVKSEITFGNFFTSEERDITETLNNSLISVFEGSRPSILDDVKASITLPSILLDGLQDDPTRDIGVSFLVYRTSNLFISSGLQTAQEVESLIVAATIEEETVENLASPVVTRFYLLPIEGSVPDSPRRCVFWNFSLAGGFGDWSSEGCTLVSGPGENGEPIVECHCDHLTNFAILVDLQGDIGNFVLDVLSIIGCVVSIIALTVVLVTFLSVKKLRSKRPQQVLINLCFALLGLYLSFLIGINRSNLAVGCVIFGAMIHYFCLASVAWMSVEATIMYLLFVKVFDTGIRYFMRKASVIAWGLPLLVVVISAIIRPTNYTGNYCFPQAGTLTFTIAVAVLLAVMLCYNLGMFALVIRTLTCKRRSNEGENNAETIKRVQNAIAISVLLGLGWLFGFLAIGGAQFIFNLLFLILNSLQGLFVFVFFCLRNKDVVALWRAKFLPSKESLSDPRVLKKSEENRTSVGTDGTNTIPRKTDESDKATDSTGMSESIPMVKSQ